MKRGLILVLISALLSGWGAPLGSADESADLKAAFIRGNDLWVKAGSKETRVTRGEYIRNPRWSYDGRWVAFTKGEAETEVGYYDTRSGQLRLAGPGRNQQWSPGSNRLAYQTVGHLNLISLERPGNEGNEAEPVRITEQVGNFSWLPDGKGLLVSTVAERLPNDKWSDIKLYKVMPDADQGIPQLQLFYKIPSESEGFFAVMTSPFKWSQDGQWIAFLAVPTASLSADGNTLCFLSSNAGTFVKAGQMLNHPDWFHWAPDNRLFAYIEGSGREATMNKKLTVIEDIPAIREKPYTPAGYVDGDFTWQNRRTIIVSRTPESEWSADESKRPLPYLAKIDLFEGKQFQVTSPPSGFGDFFPVLVKSDSKLAWIRTNRNKAEVMLGGAEGEQPRRWIRHLTPASNYYERWNWSEVIDYYSLPSS